jgi:uncharacterized RDD family membrane protein YckC
MTDLVVPPSAPVETASGSVASLPGAPSPLARVAAAAIDMTIVRATAVAVVLLTAGGSMTALAVPAWASLLAYLLIVVVPAGAFHRTPGKALTGLRLVTVPDRPVRWRTTVKYLVIAAIAVVPGVGELVLVAVVVAAAFLPACRSLLDYVAGTRVVRSAGR